MKKIWIPVVLSLLLLSACSSASSTLESSGQAADPSSAADESSQTETPDQTEDPDPSTDPERSETGQIVEKSYGSFFIPLDWFEAEELSDDEQAFYLKTGTPLDSPTSNISVSEGANNYAFDDYMSFAQAIEQQLRPQVAASGGSYTGGGSFTDKEYPLITMNIESNGLKTTQYYIVGDYRFILVHATDFDDAGIQDLEEAALTIVNSFEWAD